MPSLFNLIRGVVLGSAILFSIICLAMAGHFQSVLASSDLTRFVPFAIFVCSASLFIITALLGCSLLLKDRNPISTRIELSCLGLAGILWLVLGVYLTTSESQSADVECFSSETSTVPLDASAASFHTDQYQAMYRVLMVFALLNAILRLLGLAWKKHKQGDQHMWFGPVTSFPWFNSYSKPAKRGGRSNQAGILPTNRSQSHRYTEAPVRKHSSRREAAQPAAPPEMKQSDNYSPAYAAYRSRPERQQSGRSAPERQYSGRSTMPERQRSGRSGRSGPERQYSGRSGRSGPERQYSGRRPYSPPGTSMSESFEHGGMRNPNRK
ncbi:hypothetical protein V5O48_002323 [Marasmius crinis-equi]|uniref:MARVEL domain-containing protein n=1 Tax=Marasmius crinis-equi TaxID=585013 RepID=A0ABR3FWS0_9AGAR